MTTNRSPVGFGRIEAGVIAGSFALLPVAGVVNRCFTPRRVVRLAAILIDERNHMTPNDTSRRDFFRVAAAGAVAASAVAVPANSALANQPNMERALSLLNEALGSLREATANKGGHRVNAIGLVQQAISEVRAGIQYAGG
jgi:hypothetical protein